jgi:hypothetical protein
VNHQLETLPLLGSPSALASGLRTLVAGRDLCPVVPLEVAVAPHLPERVDRPLGMTAAMAAVRPGEVSGLGGSKASTALGDPGELDRAV